MTAENAPVEALFYHLERITIEETLAPLLEKCRERGWRALVRAPQIDRLKALDTYLWTYRPDSFLPHGLAGGAHDARQPLLLTTAEDNPNRAQVVFAVGQAPFGPLEGLARICVLFDGGDAEALAHARAQWKQAKALGLAATYWKQGETGRWTKQA